MIVCLCAIVDHCWNIREFSGRPAVGENVKKYSESFKAFRITESISRLKRIFSEPEGHSVARIMRLLSLYPERGLNKPVIACVFLFIIKPNGALNSVYFFWKYVAGTSRQIWSQLNMMMIVYESINVPVGAVPFRVDIWSIKGIPPFKCVVLERIQ